MFFYKERKRTKEHTVLFIKNVIERENVAFFWKECMPNPGFWTPAERSSGSARTRRFLRLRFRAYPCVRSQAKNLFRANAAKSRKLWESWVQLWKSWLSDIVIRIVLWTKSWNRSGQQSTYRTSIISLSNSSTLDSRELSEYKHLANRWWLARWLTSSPPLSCVNRMFIASVQKR